MSTPFVVSYVALWVLVATLGIAVYALYHHFGQMYLNSRDGRDAQGPDIGSLVQQDDYSTVSGDVIRIRDHSAPTVLLFVGVDCQACSTLVSQIEDFRHANQDLGLVMFCGGDLPDVREWATFTESIVIPDPGYRIAAGFKVGITPFAVSVSSSGNVTAKGVANDREDLEYFAGAARQDQDGLDRSTPSNEELSHEQFASLGRD